VKGCYVGITGCTTPSEVRTTVRIANNCGFTNTSPHRFMLGILVSHKTLKSGKHPTNPRYPSLFMVSNLLELGRGKCFRTIHYNTKERRFSSEVMELLDDVGSCDGVQLNIMNPDPSEILIMKESFPQLEIIFQLNKAFKDKNHQEIGTIIKENYYMVDHVLIDMSMGTGKIIDQQLGSSLYHDLMDIDCNVGFAGGFSNDNIKMMIESFRESLQTTKFSIDVESGVRTNNGLDMEKISQYLVQSRDALLL